MPLSVWIAFLVFVALMVALDLGVFHRAARVITVPEALAWTAAWIVLALVFNVAVFYLYGENWTALGIRTEHLTGEQAALEFFTGYLLEKSLSVDNIFVIAMIFAYFQVPAEQQHRVLFWGIFGAVVLRGIMIAGGAVLIDRFDWIVYLFGALLIFSAVRMMVMRHDSLEPERNPFVRAAKRMFPVTDEYHGSHFFIVRDGRRFATPLFLALILVETSDVMFALDSIPAIFAVTREPFLVFTSNIFAILGLRSLYFALAGLMHRFRYLKSSLVFLLAYVGVKMMLSHHHPIPNNVSLAIIGGILSVGVLASIWGGRDTAALESPVPPKFLKIANLTYRQARRTVILVLGSTVLLIGIALIVLPGPAFIVIPAGLSILAIEFAWARRWLNRIKDAANNAREAINRRRNANRHSEQDQKLP